MFGFQSLDRNTRQQLLLVAIPPLVLALLISGIVYFWSWDQDASRSRAAAEKDLVALRTSLRDRLSVPLRDLSGIARAPQVNEALGESDPVRRRDLIASALYPLILQNPAYFQVRWIRASGIEGVRIELDRSTEQVHRLPADQLQNKEHRDYHQAIMDLAPYHLYLSPPNLNREHGAIEHPLRPTMRVAVRLPRARGTDNGYLIINVALASVLDADMLSQRTDLELYMARPDGDWILHPEPGYAWASELGHDKRLVAELPTLWNNLKDTRQLTSYVQEGRWFLAPVFLETTYAGRLQNPSGAYLYVMLREPHRILSARRQEAFLEATMTFLALLVGTGLFLYPYSKRLRQSLELQRTTQAQADSLAEKNREIEQLNSQLTVRSDRAESAARAKSTFLANMSHEIRTPMNAILGLLDMLEMSGLPKRQSEQVGKIQKAARALLQILNDVLDLSKLEAGKFRIVEEPFALETVVRQCAQLFQPGFDNKHVELAVWLDPELPWCVTGDSHRLGQVLNNLIGNALKFTTWGSVTLSVTQASRQDGQVQVAFSVSDTGIGIPEDKLNTLFGAFEQADASTTREYGGSGLGLAICQTLIEAMGGEVQVQSEVGRGTEFHFTLPFQVAPDDDQKRRELPLRKVLLVENHSQTARLMEACFRTWGVDCAVAETAEEGIRHFLAAMENHPYDAIVTDWRLPGRDGVWMVETIQNYIAAQRVTIKPAVILVSSSDEAELRARLDQNQALTSISDVLVKPVTPSALFDALLNHQPSSYSQPQTSDPDSGRFKGARVLLAEDNELNQEVALGYLERLGVKADLAVDGTEAVTMINQVQYDLVLMDQHMPGMDGLEACRAIRQQFDAQQLPIIAITAAAFEDDILRSRAAGMNDHLSKPVSLAELEAALTRWLRPAPSPGQGDTHPAMRADDALPEELREDPALARRVLDSFLRRYDPDQGGQTDLPEDLDQLRHWLHDLKGAAATIGLYQLAGLAAKDEAKVKGPSRESLASAEQDRILAKLDDAVALVRQWREQLIPPRQSGPKPPETLETTLRALRDRLEQSLIPTNQQLTLLEEHADDPRAGPRIRQLIGHIEAFRFDDARSLIDKLLNLP